MVDGSIIIIIAIVMIITDTIITNHHDLKFHRRDSHPFNTGRLSNLIWKKNLASTFSSLNPSITKIKADSEWRRQGRWLKGAAGS